MEKKTIKEECMEDKGREESVYEIMGEENGKRRMGHERKSKREE